MATGTNHSPHTREGESRVSRLRRKPGQGENLTRRATLDYGRELKTVLVFAGMIAAAAALLGALTYWGALDSGSDIWLMAAFALGIIVTCALSSSLAFLIMLRHKLLLVTASSLALIVGATVSGWEPLAGLAKVVFATSAGLWISIMLTSVGQIMLITGLIIIVDFYSVFLGPTRKIVESGTAWIDYLTISLPVFGAEASSQIGISDIIFFSLFVGVSITYALRRASTAFSMTVSFLATMVVGVRLEIGVPALPLLSVFFLLANADVLYNRFLQEPGQHRVQGNGAPPGNDKL